jgi:hypothetical protein
MPTYRLRKIISIIVVVAVVLLIVNQSPENVTEGIVTEEAPIAEEAPVVTPEPTPEPEPEPEPEEEPVVTKTPAARLAELKTYLAENYDDLVIDGSTSMIQLHQALSDMFSSEPEEVKHSKTVEALDRKSVV